MDAPGIQVESARLDNQDVSPEQAANEGQSATVTADLLTGNMGEMLKGLIEDFRTGKKGLNELAVRPEDGCLRLKWPHAFAGYGFTPKQILDGLTERGWMEADSEVAKVGEADFDSGVAKAIRLTQSISMLFPKREAEPVLQAVTSDVPEQLNNVPPLRSKPRKRTAPKSGATRDAAIKDQSLPPIDLPGQIAQFNELLQAARRDGKELKRRDINLLVHQKVGVEMAVHLMRGITTSDNQEFMN